MTKLEYLKQLELGLRDKITEQETYDIMRDYAEYFEEGKTQGKTEKEIISALGSPQEVVAQILDEQENPRTQEKMGDEFVNSAKIKFNNIKQRMAENKIKNEQKKKEQMERDREYIKKYQTSSEYKSSEENTVVDKTKSFGNGLLLVLLWIFVIVPFATFVFSIGGTMLLGGMCGLIGVSAVSGYLVSSFVFTGIFASLTVLFFGITALLLAVIFIKFCIAKSFGESEKKDSACFSSPEKKDEFTNLDLGRENNEKEENENA